MDVRDQLRLPDAADREGFLQTFFHPDDGIDLDRTEIVCRTCGGDPLQLRSRVDKKLPSGLWTELRFQHGESHRHEKPCPVRIRLSVPHSSTVEAMGR